MNERPRVTFYGGVGSVTGANFLLESGRGSRILVDCGLVQGERAAERANYEPFGYEPNSIQALIITHAHLDHVGRIPKLVREGYSGSIYSTPQTKALAELVLNDAVGLLAKEAQRQGTQPLYDSNDVQKALSMWKTIPYHQDFKITDDISIFLKDAGHILGSAMIEVTIKDITSAVPTGAVGVSRCPANAGSRETLDKPRGHGEVKVLFTGDLGNSPAPLLKDTELAGDVDYIVMESVYGDRNHEPKEERDRKLQDIVTAALARGGTLVIPAFSLDRTQVLLYELDRMVKDKAIPSVPIFVDSPMGTKATDIYKVSTNLFNDHVQEQIRNGDDIFAFPRLTYTSSAQESQSLDRMQGAKIILAGSGMSVGGRVIGHEEHVLPDARNTVLLVGYQSVGTAGRALAEGAKRVRINGAEIEVKAKIETLYGYSAHKDQDHLIQFVSTASDRLKKAFVCMGEPGASMALAQRLHDELNIKALMPERLKPYILM